MTDKEKIYQLKDLIKDRESLLEEDDADSVYAADMEALEWAVKELEGNENDGWIPVNEQLPKECFVQQLLVTDGAFVYKAMFSRGLFLWSDYTEHNRILAWQPYPEPYRPKEDKR